MTAQIHEGLILNGRKLSLACELSIPEHERIIKISEEEQEVIFESAMIIFSTACWRQYVGSWEIKNGKLYLIDIVGVYKLIGNEPIFAEWYSGTLYVPIGSIGEYARPVHRLFCSRHNQILFIDIKNGLVIQEREEPSIW